jgi:heme-degrading monooxygenase HmoA
MIARIWRARTTPQLLDGYRAHLLDHVAPTLRGLAGFLSVRLLSRPDGRDVQIIVISEWESLRNVVAFAGDDLDHAVIAPEAKPFLTSWDDHVRHFAVIASETALP